MTWTPRRAMLVLALCNVLWAGTYVAGKEALSDLTPIELNFLRFTIAGLAFLPLLWVTGVPVRFDRRRIPRLIMLCALGFVLNKGFEFSGLKLTTASDNALLISSEGLFTAVFGWLLLREQVRRDVIAGLALSFIGVYLVIERGLVLPHLGQGTERIAGDLLIVGALVFEALYTVMSKAEVERYPALGITAVCVIGSLSVWAPAALGNLAVAGLPPLSVRAWVGVLYIALLGTTVAYFAWIAAIRYVDAAAAAPTLFLQPLVGTVLAVIVLGERLSPATLVGGALILAGLWIVSRDPGEAEPIVRGMEIGP